MRLIFRHITQIDYRSTRKKLFKLADSQFQQPLFFFSGIVLGVFRKIAVGTGFSNTFGHLLPAVRFHFAQFLFEFAHSFFAQIDKVVKLLFIP